jgi:hypothetical protein
MQAPAGKALDGLTVPTLSEHIEQLCPALTPRVEGERGFAPDAVAAAKVDVEQQGPGLCQTVVLAGPAEGLDSVDPLSFVVGSPLESWEILHLGGGDSDAVTPPTAYAPHRVFGLGKAYSIGREVGLWCSNFLLPMVLAVKRDGTCGFFAGMEWSGDWRIVFEPETSDAFRFGLGIPLSDLSLADGEELALPASHLVCFEGGWEEGFAAARRYVREAISPAWPGGGREPLVTYNSWDGIGDTVCRDNLMPQVARAARLGVEVFVHDACWFSGGFPQGVGNYEAVDTSRWPDGLEPLADEVRRRGMKFGLWFELERTVADGQACARHPELFLGHDENDDPGQSLLLDLSRAEAQDWAFETVRRWVRPLGVEWIKWDFNFEPHRILRRTDPTGKYVFAYVAGLHALLDRILGEFPNLHLETCASGGRRFDLGMVRRSHTVWMSDHTDNAWNCRWMQYHANMMLPGQLLARSVPLGPDSGDDRVSRAQLLARMMGRLQLDGWISRLTSEATRDAAEIISWYKEVRHLVLEDYLLLTDTPTRPGDPLAAAFLRRDGAEAAVFAFASDDPAEISWTWPQRAKGLSPVSAAGDDGPSRGCVSGDRHCTVSLRPGQARGLHFVR